MAEKNETTQSCGTKKITYPSNCTFVCVCPPNGKCVWVVTTPDGTVFTGTELVAPSKPKRPHVKVVGSLKGIGLALQRVTKRKVVVPSELRDRKLRARTFRGTPADVAEALGLQLTSRRI